MKAHKSSLECDYPLSMKILMGLGQYYTFVTDLICTSLYNKGIAHEWEWALQSLGQERISSVKHKRTKMPVIGNHATRKGYKILVNFYGYSRW